jgi:hypothetical protein
MDNISLLNIINYIQNSTIENKNEYFSERYKIFKKNYPILFEMACKEQKIDTDKLILMMSLIDKIKDNHITQYDASAKIGKILYEEYIEPLVKDMPPSKV